MNDYFRFVINMYDHFLACCIMEDSFNNKENGKRNFLFNFISCMDEDLDNMQDTFMVDWVMEDCNSGSVDNNGGRDFVLLLYDAPSEEDVLLERARAVTEFERQRAQVQPPPAFFGHEPSGFYSCLPAFFGYDSCGMFCCFFIFWANVALKGVCFLLGECSFEGVLFSFGGL
jgi:hypothetical protein